MFGEGIGWVYWMSVLGCWMSVLGECEVTECFMTE